MPIVCSLVTPTHHLNHTSMIGMLFTCLTDLNHIIIFNIKLFKKPYCFVECGVTNLRPLKCLATKKSTEQRQ